MISFLKLNCSSCSFLQSIRAAHDTVQPARLFINSGELLNANINRSPSAYLANPEGERISYPHDTDKEMTVLRIEANDGTVMGLGLISWFAVHCTSMNNTNSLVSGDNKGAAEQFTEQQSRKQSYMSPNFVAAFSQSTVGDTSPNVQGPFCIDTGNRRPK